MKTILLTLLMLLTIDQTSDVLVWSNSYKLRVEDFKCIPPKYAIHTATSAVGISWDIEPVYMGWKFATNAYFDKSKSWLKNKNISTNLLRHEQCHFDIMHEGALQILISVRKLRNRPDIMNEMLRIADSLRLKYSDLNSLYDLETNHSLNVSEQKRWEEQTKFKIDSLSSILGDINYIIVK